MSILSDLSKDFLQFLDKHNLYLKIYELYGCTRSEVGILRKNTDGPYLLRIIYHEINHTIILKWTWVNCHWLDIGWLSPKESSKTEVKEIGCTLLTVLLYFAYVYSGQNKSIIFSKKDSEVFKKETYIEAQEIKQYYQGKPYCFLCNLSTDNTCNICDIIINSSSSDDTFFDIPHSLEKLLLTYQHLYQGLLQKRKTIFTIQFVKDYMKRHHYECYAKEHNKDDIEGSLGGSAKNIRYYIEYCCKGNIIIINITDCTQMTDAVKTILLHLMSVFGKEYIEVYYKQNNLLCTRNRPPIGSLSFFKKIGFEYKDDKWIAEYSQIEHYIQHIDL